MAVPARARQEHRDGGCVLGLCDGSGWQLEEDSNVSRPCECLERRRATARAAGLGGIPRIYRGVSFDRKPIRDLDPMVKRRVRDFTSSIEDQLDAGRGLWFTGDVGTGKTSVAMLVALHAREAGRSVVTYSVPRLFATIRETYGADSRRSYLDLYARLTGVELLVLDDLGAERRTEWVLEQLYSIVNERWQEQRSIVVTTNVLDLDELRAQLGAATVSRLVGICGGPIPLMGPDLRMLDGE